MSMGIVKWFKCGNDCTKCSYCWEERTSYEYDEYDAGCYIKGSCYDDKRCYMLPPLRFLIGSIKKKKSEYYENHEYDDFYNWVIENEKKQDKFNCLIAEAFKAYSLCWKDEDGKLHESNKEAIINDAAWRIRSEYEEFAYPVIHKKLRSEWRELFVKTYNSFVDKFKPYFCK